MIKFNDENIMVGYIKQLLKDFNLPSFRVYTGGTAIPGVKYIKDDLIQKCTAVTENGATWTKCSNYGCYVYNKRMINNTKNFVIKNNIYDSYTHEYLGRYLRFQRDYNNLDLMPLYNCFSNNLCTSLNINFGNGIVFNSADEHYKIYAIPVRLLQKYTIAIECDSAIELCCSIYDKYLNEELDKKQGHLYSNLCAATYEKRAYCQFTRPFIYDKLFKNEIGLSDNDKAILYSLEDSLKLFIKLPATSNSSIVILEGDYLGYNDSILSQDKTKSGDTRVSNKYITNYKIEERKGDYDFNEFKPITRLQLLEMNTSISLPFSNKLLGYLTGNTITPLDEVSDNIVRAQEIINTNGKWDFIYGAWSNDMKAIFYDYIKNNGSITDFNTDLDVLGYVDKDVEHFYTGKIKGKPVTLSNIDMYEDLYLDDKGGLQ